LALVTIAGPFNYGNVAAGGSVQGPANFEVEITASHGCNSDVGLTAVMSADNACALRAFPLNIPASGCVPAAHGEAAPTTFTVGADNLDATCTDSDGTADNGETVRLDVGVRNPGNAPATNVTVQLVSL